VVAAHVGSRQYGHAGTEERHTEELVNFDSHDYDQFDIESPPDDAVFIWVVGSRTVLVCTRAGASVTDRRLRGPDYFSTCCGSSPISMTTTASDQKGAPWMRAFVVS
jgi:hypothetical protein